MKIDIRNIAKAVNKGLDINTYIGIKTYQDGCDYLYPNGYFNPATGMNLGIITNKWELTEAGQKLIEEIEGKEALELEWYSKVHAKLQQELIILTGKPQKTINGRFSFLPNMKDFTNKLSKTIKKYNLTDKNKLEKMLINHIKRSYKADFKMVQLMEYYISKNDNSQLASEYDNFEEKNEKTIKETLVNTEELF